MYELEKTVTLVEDKLNCIRILIRRYNLPGLIVKVNDYGVKNNNTMSDNIIMNINKILLSVFNYKIYLKLLKFTSDGPILIMLLEEDPEVIKKICIDIEGKHLLGEFIDIEVYDVYLKALKRSDFGIDRRGCLICASHEHTCLEAGKHSRIEINQYIRSKYETFIKSSYVINQ
ncbi:MAG TPA: citrate lyase holo-[acyl-carrier protein] synthase [Clostridiaceae bacterium]